ncbi:MRP family ATP-binding protein [Marinilabiliaceae bacterium JC040]|nr:MRP family ATP-binding protein [Marinilabiliaceae bacterium JC040]
MSFYPKQITDALADVVYPGSNKKILDLDMVQGIKIEGNKVRFKLIFQRSNDPFILAVKKKCLKLVQDALGEEAEVEVITDNVHDMENPTSLDDVRNIIAVASGKGGVGKSTVASNLAVALAKSGAKVGLIDADIFGPSIPKMFGVEDSRPLIQEIDGKNKIIPIEKYGVKMLSIGFFINPKEATVWRGPMAGNALKQMIEEANWGELDYLLFDLPPGTSDIHLTLVQTLPVTGAIVVSTPQDVALADAIKGIDMFEGPGVNVPVLGLIENMAWFTPAELPNNKYYIFGKDGCKRLAEEKNTNLLGQIPIVQSIREAGDKGSPVALDENSATGIEFMKLAENVMNSLEERVVHIDATKRVKLK